MAELTIAAVGLAFSVSQTIFAALQCSELKDLFGSDIESLERSVETLQAVLHDADSKQANGFKLSAQEQVFIAKINDALYDAEDCLDAYAARAKLKRMSREGRNKLYTEVRGLVSLFKSLAIDSPDPEVKKTTKRLEKIGRDAQNFKFDSLPMKRKREETCSHVGENHIIGREVDQKKIVDMLLHPIVQGELPVLAIVGIGGLGKTTLAQLVYKDPKIQNEFSLRLWVCVSDQGGKQFNLRAILAEIYMSATSEKSIGKMGLDQLVRELKRKLDQKKYLLVLDDLWSEKTDECHSLVDILIGSGEKGSRIVVTTRSKKTATAIGNVQSYGLKGLSDEDSWHLFEKKVGKDIGEGHELFEICKDTVKKCVNVPLAIKVVGSLLRDKPKNEWQSFQNSRLLENKKDDNDIMWILKFSYYHLSPSQKSCFTYCALFPKDFKIKKEDLISMWMAHGYVKYEDEAEYHFEILGLRCFFQDIEEKYDGGIVFKIHDLIHDMAQEIAGKEIYIANSATTQLDTNIRHLYDGAPASRTQGFVTTTNIRSYVHCHSDDYREMTTNIQFVSRVLAKWRHLRVLDLHQFGIRQLRKAIGELLHLRHLDLHGNKELGMLPQVITRLVHLQFLNLGGCSKLKELPKDLKKLVNLRTLYVPVSLEYMPLGMGTMTSLTRLNKFIVGHRKSCVKQENKLEDLRVPRNLKGSLEIRVKGGYKHAKEYCGEGGYILNTQHLNSISIRWYRERNVEGRVGNDEDLLEDLQPPQNLEELQIKDYQGVRIPRWAREDSLTTSLPNLVKIELFWCKKLEELPWLGRLQHLKTLWLEQLRNVEYMENRRSIGSSSDVASNSSTVVESSTMLFFPSLEHLRLSGMTKLKGWWTGSSDCTSGAGEDEIVNNDNNNCMLTTPAHPLPSFPRLSQLFITQCPNLTSIPLCPAVKSLELWGNVNKKIGVWSRKRVGSSSGNVVENSSNQYLKALPMVSFESLVNMKIEEDNEVESLSEYEELLCGCSSSLKSLTLYNCMKLRSVCQGGLEYLTALEELTLIEVLELKFDETNENEEMPWRSIGKCLRSLKLDGLKSVVRLPKGMRYLTSLQSLHIERFRLLKEIPEWIECLSSLQSLKIKCCTRLEMLPIRALQKLTSLEKFELETYDDNLRRRCEKPDGEYWPILEHIPHFRISR